MDELEKDEQDEIHRLVADVKVALRKAFGAEGFNVAWNDGKVSGQSMPHLHVHVLPRTTGDKGIVEYEPRSFLYRPEWYREGCIEISPNEELLLVAQKVAKHLPKRPNS